MIQVTCAMSSGKSAFLTFLIIFMSSLLLFACFHYVIRALLSRKTRFWLACHIKSIIKAPLKIIDLKFCPSLKKLHTNTARKKFDTQSMMSFYRLISNSQLTVIFWAPGTWRILWQTVLFFRVLSRTDSRCHVLISSLKTKIGPSKFDPHLFCCYIIHDIKCFTLRSCYYK